MADPVVGITNGVPTSGTGTITTLGQTLLDGANVTIGATTDAASTSTDATSISAMKVWKQISKSVQLMVFGAGTAAAAQRATLASDDPAVTTLGGVSDAAVTAGATGSLSAKLRSISRDIVANIVLAAGSAVIGKVGIDQTTDLTTNKVRAFIHDGTTALTVLAGSSGAPAASVAALPVSIRDVNTNDQKTMAGSAPVVLPSDQRYQTGMSPRAFVAAFSTLTRPANTTAYTAADSISDNATAGSVTALSATVSDTNDDPLTLVDIIVTSTDTGLAGKKIRAYLFNSDPTASSGVSGGDNAAYSQKKAGYIGSFMGWMETGFSDGTVGRLVPTFNETNFTQAGGFIVAKPTSGAKTLYIQYQAVEAFTPSASSTTIIGSVRGFQGRAS